MTNEKPPKPPANHSGHLDTQIAELVLAEMALEQTDAAGDGVALSADDLAWAEREDPTRRQAALRKIDAAEDARATIARSAAWADFNRACDQRDRAGQAKAAKRAAVRAKVKALVDKVAAVVVTSIEAGDFDGADDEKAEILATAARMVADG